MLKTDASRLAKGLLLLAVLLAVALFTDYVLPFREQPLKTAELVALRANPDDIQKGILVPASCGAQQCDKGGCYTVNYGHPEWGGACSPPASPPDAAISQDKTATVQGETFTVTYGRSGGGDAASCELQRQPPGGGDYSTIHSNGGGTSNVSQGLSTPTGSWTYRAQCSGTGSSPWVSLSHALNATPPSFDISGGGGGGGGGGGTSATINEGEGITLTWSCVLSSSSSGLNFSTGGETSGSVGLTPAQTTEYTLTCSNGGQASVTATVLHPTLSISAAPSLIRSGQTSSISWSASSVDSCTVSENNPNIVNAWSGLSGTETTSALSGETRYTLACENEGGSVSSSITIRQAPSFEEI